MNRWPLLLALALPTTVTVACTDAASTTTPDGGGAPPAIDGGAPGDGGSSAPSDAALDTAPNAEGGDAATFALTSSAFVAGGNIPAAHTCDGTDLSIPLAWSNPPPGTQSYAVVMRDLSLAGSGNYHWVIWDVSASSLAAGIAQSPTPPTPSGAKQSTWSFGAQYGYGGPCPPGMGTEHEYELTVYSFATASLPSPGDPTSPTSADSTIQANKTGSASVRGRYTKQ